MPPAGELFSRTQRAFWDTLSLPEMERCRILSDLETLDFAQAQVKRLEAKLNEIAAHDARTPLLIQLPGIGHILAITILAAIGDIARFPSARQLVGYAGLGARVHASGNTYHTGRITKSGRRDLRWAMVEAAHTAVKVHPRWRRELHRLEPRLGKQKALVAIAHKLLVAVWHVLTYGCANRHASPSQLAQTFFRYAYRMGVKNLPKGTNVRQYVREQLDRLGVGEDLTHFYWGRRRVNLPPSSQSP